MRKKEEATNEKIIDAGGSEIAGKYLYTQDAAE